MLRIFSLLIAACYFLLLSNFAFSQDSLNTIPGWTIESHKQGEGKYELVFKLPSTQGWQLYAPDQAFDGVKMAELIFPDSSISVAENFKSNPETKLLTSPFFGPNVRVFENSTEWRIPVEIKGTVPEKISGALNYSYGKNDEFLTAAFNFNVALEGGVKTSTQIKVASIDRFHPVANCGDDDTSNKSMLTIFLLGFLGGLVALLTPCVFPMIPVTVTFFTKKSGEKAKGVSNAVLYGLFIFLIYIAITIPFHLFNIRPEIFNNISTNVWLNLLFFAVFVVFALSFFGLFEIGLPAGLANKMDSKSGLGNIGGIFFMAATLAIVSFSCTGPILGTLLVNVADKGAMPLTIGAAGFGLALGLPFALFAMFPHWLQSLPKSGGWMTDVKVVLGFLEIALAIKFFSNADLVEQWGLLKREIFVGLWAIISLLIVLYLAGILKFSHSSPVKKFSSIRITLIILFSAIFLYLLPGLTNTKWADLKLGSGLLPPRTYSIYGSAAKKQDLFEPIHNKYTEALELARKENKPVLIDFTGWACVNCRKMEDIVWSDKVVDSMMRKEFVVVSLYVDERRKLPLTEQTVVTLSNGSEKNIITVGDKWATFQTENFGATSQPQYAIITADQKVLTKTKYYTPDAREFAEWLECGLKAFAESRK